MSADTASAPTQMTVVDAMPTWDDEKDPENPRNWSARRRASCAILIASISLLSSFASSILVPGVPAVMQHFGTTNHSLGTLTTSVYVLGLGFGPFLLSPLSEIYGRWIIYITSLAAFTAFQIGCALSNSMTTLIVMRFLSGCAGGVAPSLGQASMSDLWTAERRGRWTAILSLGPMSGPAIGNLIAALILSARPWPWIFWMTTIISAVLLVAVVFLLRETYEPVILRRRQAKRQAKEPRFALPLQNGGQRQLDPAALLSRAITRPIRFLVTSPIIAIFGTFLAYVYGMLYLLLTSLPLLFGAADARTGLFNYGFSSTSLGLAYLGLAAGFLVGFGCALIAQTRLWTILTRRNGEGRPEYRLLPMTAGMTLFPIAMFLYGWSAEKGAAWIAPELGTFVFGAGIFMSFQSIQLYIMEAFIPYSASAIAAVTLLRSIAGTVFPLFGQQMFQRLGYGVSGSIIAACAVPAIPFPLILYKHGAYIRKRWPFRP
ncbi:MFS general substrate transporter [Exidia glandulosa HHB12029]|uniref:MFS general substrate transporter n=1 Tax=Exidia glandulosa HHB12029 TaxID=1314781 RepID=A0A165CJ57_EXIGL|nr:MFS general substrate transporter [Exidia glandulosa HHB12029]